MAFPNLSEIVTTTLRNRSGKLADNVTRNNALLHRLEEKGTIEKVDGGRTIVRELEYAQNSTAMWYSGYQALNIQPSQVMTAAEFNFRQAAVAVSISGLEMLQNAGEERVIDLLKGRIKNAERTMENLLGVAVYSDGTNSMMPGGLQFLLPDSPINTVGGINRTTWPFWANLVYSMAANAGVTGGAATAGIGGGPFTAGNIQPAMNAIYNQLVRGREHPDLILADNNCYNAYLGSMQAIQRVTSEKVGQAGFTSLKYMGADVILDGGFNGYATDFNPAAGGCPANHMYFINSEYLYFQPHKKMNMSPLGPESRFAVNQDAMVKLIGWAGNMTISNGRMHGVLKA